MNLNTSKLIEIIDPQAGEIKETTFDAGATASARLDAAIAGQYMRLSEAAATTSQFPALLRGTLRTILFDVYNEFPSTHTEWIKLVQSNQQFETWVEGNSVGKLPIVPENGVYPRVELNLDRSVQIRNDKRGAIIPVSWEMLFYDKTNLIRQQTEDLARAMAFTVEDDAYTVLMATGNYTRTSAADNDIGNNTATTTFDADGMELALSTLRTMKDRKSGRYLGIGASGLVLVVGPRLEFAAKMLLMGETLRRTHGATSAEIFGTGTDNPFRGLVTQIIVSPLVATRGTNWGWVLMEPRKGVVKQQVLPLELTQKTSTTDWNYFNQDTLEYKVREVYGIGMQNDRFGFLSDSVTAPTVA